MRRVKAELQADCLIGSIEGDIEVEADAESDKENDDNEGSRAANPFSGAELDRCFLSLILSPCGD